MSVGERISVLLVAASSSTSGGGERQVADLLQRLPEHGVDVSLACPPGGDLPAVAATSGVALFPFEVGTRSTRLLVSRLADIIRKTSPAVVHAHGSRAAFFVRLADKRAANRCVYTLHGIHVDTAGSLARRMSFTEVERLLKRRTALFITVCRSDADKGASLGVVDADRMVVVHNGIDALQSAQPGLFRAELGLGEDDPLVLSVGRFHEQKDQTTLLRAWRLVAEKTPTAHLALIGQGRLEPELRAQIHSEGLGDSVNVLQPRADLGPAYADTDIFALSSRWEGLPYVVLEAMAAELPVVSTNVDGIPEAVVDGETGLLVSPQDPEHLAEALLELLADPGRRAALGRAGARRAASEFSLESMLDGIVAAYERVLSVAPAD